jgi:hypothetical protein
MGPPPSLLTGDEFLHDIVEWYMDNLPFLRNFNYKIIIKNFLIYCPFEDKPSPSSGGCSPSRKRLLKMFKSLKSKRFSEEAAADQLVPLAHKGCL